MSLICTLQQKSLYKNKKACVCVSGGRVLYMHLRVLWGGSCVCVCHLSLDKCWTVGGVGGSGGEVGWRGCGPECCCSSNEIIYLWKPTPRAGPCAHISSPRASGGSAPGPLTFHLFPPYTPHPTPPTYRSSFHPPLLSFTVPPLFLLRLLLPLVVASRTPLFIFPFEPPPPTLFPSFCPSLAVFHYLLVTFSSFRSLSLFISPFLLVNFFFCLYIFLFDVSLCLICECVFFFCLMVAKSKSFNLSSLSGAQLQSHVSVSAPLFLSLYIYFYNSFKPPVCHLSPFLVTSLFLSFPVHSSFYPA